MQVKYYAEDDIFILRISDKPIVREVSQDWNIGISYADDGSIVEMVILDAAKQGALPAQWAETV
ncbi:hypothetical protein AXE65_08825 [Ventosimonas gracilis]|uniref:DUF2283 domain-containing protein n=1 Tax=Ventosimonas gracilis TaxID=1680762 RepID=A0A139SXP9_9GAMM|nr:DUF2283 domain-containing protein [Ventosimonas gracilis]KXU39376.1 hypothetical protein AXE65_08825 [Ventosimonas gracilis]